MKANPKGAAGEEYAARVLAGLGYEIKARNFSSHYGEIDIIARKGGVLAFVEVKSRRQNSAVSGFEAVTRAKQRRIILTAIWYMKTHDAQTRDLQPRFDVFSVVTSDGDIVSHDYLEGAFDGEPYG